MTPWMPRIAGFALFVSALALAGPASAQVQDKDQQRCVAALNKSFAKLADTQGKTLLGCIGARAKGASADACVAEPSRKVESARDKTGRAADKSCATVPDFGPTDPNAVNAAASAAARGLVTDLFGGALDLALATRSGGRDAAKCQAAVAKAALKCQSTRLKEFQSCQKKGLKTGAIASAGDLADCVGDDPKGKIAKTCVEVVAAKAVSKQCVAKGVDLGAAFPGCQSSTAEGIAACVAEATECRVCDSLSDADALALACPVCVPDARASLPPGAGPPGAHLSVADVGKGGVPGAADLVSSVFDFGPSGTDFEHPVTIAIRIDPGTAANTPVSVVALDDANDVWVPLDGTTILGEHAVAQTDHFSRFSTAQSPTGPGCSNIWSGGPGTVPPLHTVGGLSVSGGTKTAEDVVFSGPSAISLGSTWNVPACSTTVSGSFGPGLVGDGAWIDYSNGGGAAVPQSGGGFSFQLKHDPPGAPRGPFFGLTDPCLAPLGVYAYNLNVHFAADCADKCASVDCSDGNPCTDDVCNPVDASCSNPALTGSCGSSGAGLCVSGQCIVEVVMTSGQSGVSACAAEGLVCDGVPVGNGACTAFNPGAGTSQDLNGWSQGVLCNGEPGLACTGRVDNCHVCPQCNPNLTCTIQNSPLLTALYASCVSP